MENLRNNDGSNDMNDSSASDYIAYDDDASAVEPPPAIGQDERRMHVRAYNFWAGLLGDRQFPSVEDLTPDTDDDFGPNSVLLDFTNGVENPTIQFLGEALRNECDLDDSITSIDDVPARSLLSRITDHYLQIIANQAPIGFEAEFVNQRGVAIMYRGILLPFSTDDDTIDFIYGVINWKEVATDAVTHELEQQVAEAMRAAPVAAETGPVWADAPASGPLADVEDAQDEPLELTAEDIDPEFSVLDDEASLADWLSAARNSADNAAHCEQRSRAALYAAVGQAYDFYLMTQAHPEDYQTLLEDSGLTTQERAPMTPIVKLVFGINYDKTRLTEYASALRFAENAGIAKGEFAAFLENHDGGLKAIVNAERVSRKPDVVVEDSESQHENMLDRLRSAPARELADIETGEEEFVVLVARRDSSGQLAIVGPVLGDRKLTDRVLNKTQV
ncbi:hypothetical protein [Parasphingorhabdus sp.]|uniref:PAS domain-containing protein n=1 Tax=Parasphingorhabdus sp. TaxID=2709688 RepID=UPI00326370BA